MQGDHTLAPVHREIMDWFSKQFGVRALDFYCEKRETSKGASQLVHLIMETVEDVKKIQSRRADNALIAERFLKYFQLPESHDATLDPLKSSVFQNERSL